MKTRPRLSPIVSVLLAALALIVVSLALPAAAVAQDTHGAPTGATGHAPAPAGDTHAGDDHGHGHEAPAGVIPSAAQGLVPAIVSLLVFAVVFAILAVKVWPIITKGLDDRANKIREEIAAAEAARKQAKDALEMYERSLAEARTEAQKMLEKTKSQQMALAEELKAKADVELNAMRERAKRDIEAAKRTALNEISAEAANIAVVIAGKILKREVNARDQERLIAESMNELQPAAPV